MSKNIVKNKNKKINKKNKQKNMEKKQKKTNNIGFWWVPGWLAGLGWLPGRPAGQPVVLKCFKTF